MHVARPGRKYPLVRITLGISHRAAHDDTHRGRQHAELGDLSTRHQFDSQ
jgi:hypothetical protein